MTFFCHFPFQITVAPLFSNTYLFIYLVCLFIYATTLPLWSLKWPQTHNLCLSTIQACATTTKSHQLIYLHFFLLQNFVSYWYYFITVIYLPLFVQLNYQIGWILYSNSYLYNISLSQTILMAFELIKIHVNVYRTNLYIPHLFMCLYIIGY